MKVHIQFKREPINAGLTFMVIYSCFCACFCTPDFHIEERERGGETERLREGGKGRAGESTEGLRGCLDARGAARWLGPL